jgi:hypothetical protein
VRWRESIDAGGLYKGREFVSGKELSPECFQRCYT